MSVIQKIRDKYAALVIALIALSLIAFILMDAGKRGSGGNVTVNDALGEVNGVSISYGQFMDRAKQSERMYEQRGQTIDENTRQQCSFKGSTKLPRDE